MAGRVRNRSSNAEMRHNGVLSFFGLGNLKIRPKIFQKSGTGFRRMAKKQPTPIFFTGRKNIRPIEYKLLTTRHRGVKCRFTT